MRYLKIFFLTILSLLASDFKGQTGNPSLQKKPFVIGETVSFHSKVLDENRTINVYLPPSYHKDPTSSYPVIYLLDGSAHEDFIHIAGLVQFASFPWIGTIPETIVIGIANVDRKRDFTYPSQRESDRKMLPTSGNSKAFIRFIETELQPLVESSYRTLPSKTLIGQSLGGLLATEILFKNPELFENYIIVSPSLWWDESSLLREDPGKTTSSRSVYIAVGKEGRDMEKMAKRLYKKLKKGHTGHLCFHFLREQDHGDALHLAVYDGLEQLFRKE